MARMRIIKLGENDYRVEERILGLFWRRVFSDQPFYQLEHARDNIEHWSFMFWKYSAKQVKHRPWFPSNVVAVFKGTDIVPDFESLWKF